MWYVFLHQILPFQSTPPRRRRHYLSMLSCHNMFISIHASEKEATARSHHLPAWERFQSTPPRRRRPNGFPFNSPSTVIFQSTPPRRRRRYAAYSLAYRLEFQSTPPRRRRLQHIVIPQLSCTYLVSTTFLSAIFSFISQYIVLFFLF